MGHLFRVGIDRMCSNTNPTDIPTDGLWAMRTASSVARWPAAIILLVMVYGIAKTLR